AFPVPLTPGVASRPAKIGDALTFYALGLGQTSPPVTAGFPAPGAEPLARVPGTPRVMFGGASSFVTQRGTAIPFYVGLKTSSGGQPFDLGTFNGVPLREVVDEEDRIAHILEKPLQDAEVEGEVDWTRRFDHMQQHTGQHLLSAVLVELFDIPTLSFHLGAVTS